MNFQIDGEVTVAGDTILIDGVDTNQLATILGTFAGKDVVLTIKEQ